MNRLTYEHRGEENGHRDVEDRTGDVKEPVRSHREETKEKEEEEQTATIFLHLTVGGGSEREKEDKRKGQRDGERKWGKKEDESSNRKSRYVVSCLRKFHIEVLTKLHKC